MKYTCLCKIHIHFIQSKVKPSVAVNAYNPRTWHKSISPVEAGRPVRCYLQCYLQLHTEFETILGCVKCLRQTRLTVLAPKNLITGPGE